MELMSRLGVFQPGDKHRSFSTSTPLFSSEEHKLRSLSVSICSATTNDSGLGASLQDISVTSFAGCTLACSTVSVCATPTTCDHASPVKTFSFDISASPVSSKCFSIRNINSNNKSKSFLSRRSLDSDTRFTDDEYSFESGDKTLNSSQKINSSRESLDRSFARRLDFDLDIYMPCNESDNKYDSSTSIPYAPSPHERQLSEEFASILQKFSPSEPDRLIGRKMGRDNVDILLELSIRNIGCLSTILSLLEPEDLCRMCMVSRDWKSLCQADSKANARRKHLLQHNRSRYNIPGKENAGKRLTNRQTRTGAVPLQNLPTVQLFVQLPEVCAATTTTTDQFINAASRLKNDEKLQKCPKCRKPAKVLPVQERGKCENPDCNYDYCIKCLYEFHGSVDCVPIASKKTKTDAIGTKKSKKNLKRL